MSNGGGDFLHAGRGLLQRGGLGGGPVGQVGVAGRNLTGLAVQDHRVVADGRHRVQQAVLHLSDQRHQLPDAVAAQVFRLAGKVAPCDGLQVRANFRHRAHEVHQQITVAERQQGGGGQQRAHKDHLQPVALGHHRRVVGGQLLRQAAEALAGGGRIAVRRAQRRPITVPRCVSRRVVQQGRPLGRRPVLHDESGAGQKGQLLRQRVGAVGVAVHFAQRQGAVAAGQRHHGQGEDHHPQHDAADGKVSE